MEKLNDNDEDDSRQTSRRDIRKYQMTTIILGVALACCVIIILVVIPILATREKDDANDAPTKSGTMDDDDSDCLCTDPADIQDVIIVGGGPSGTYFAYRLRKNTTLKNDKILLLEANNRIGGRLHSFRLPGIDYNMAELGGMRFVEGEQKLLTDVIKDFAIPVKEFGMDENNTDRPFLLRDVFLQQKHLTTAELPYNLKEDEKHLYPDTLQA